MSKLKGIILMTFALFAMSSINATVSDGDNSAEPKEAEEFSVNEIIGHHISDSHSWNVFGYTNSDGEKVEYSIHLPIILYHNGDIFFGMSSAFEDGAVVAHGDNYYVMAHDKIYLTDASGEIEMADAEHVSNERPLDLSITKNIVSMFMSVCLLLLIFVGAARSYKKSSVPRGGSSLVEMLVLFVKEIGDEQIGKEKSSKYLPYLMTLFFFIWLNNLIGLVPFFPGSSNLSGNISFTATLAIFTFLVTNVTASKSYWKHNLTVPGVPAVMKILIVPIEIISMFTKPFTLLIRLFANVTGGHIIIISLISMIFIVQSYVMTAPSILLSLIIFILELVFGALQAYIFTLLSALYIGLAVSEDEHEHK